MDERSTRSLPAAGEPWSEGVRGTAPPPGPYPPRPTRWREQAGRRAPRILIVDDEPDIREALREALSAHLHADVVVVEDAERARSVLESGPCDVVLLDHMLPGLEGARLLPWMGEARLLPRTIMITALPPDALPTPPLLLAGAAAVFRKPLDYPRLLEAIRALLPPGKDLAARGHH